MTRVTREALATDLRAHAFNNGAAGTHPPRRVGAEVELIPIESRTGYRCAIESEGVTSTLPFLRRYGNRLGWREGVTSKGTPCFTLPQGGTITFEPGGQIEYSSPPCRSAKALLSLLRNVVPPLCVAAAGEGIELLASGIDPLNPIERAPLLLRPKRYERMAEYLATRGPAGARMMRQTAAFQLSLDFDDEPWLRWRVLNAMAPYTSAIFANSPIYAGEPTGHQSERSAVWRAVDPSRTGIVYDAVEPVEGYLEFALSAPAILLPTMAGEYRPFGEWLQAQHPTLEDWQDHLSTLFPEVRPRGHLELRSPDAVSPEWYAAPAALLAGILYDPDSLRAADDLLGSPDPGLLVRAGARGLHDAGMARKAADLAELAIRGCRTLGASYFDPGDLEQATVFFDTYTLRGRAPADDVMENAIAA